MSPASSRDAYGFLLKCDDEQSAARERCAQSSSKQALKWAKYAQKQSLPSGEKLKKLCRKVDPSFILQRIRLVCHEPYCRCQSHDLGEMAKWACCSVSEALRACQFTNTLRQHVRHCRNLTLVCSLHPEGLHDVQEYGWSHTA